MFCQSESEAKPCLCLRFRPPSPACQKTPNAARESLRVTKSDFQAGPGTDRARNWTEKGTELPFKGTEWAVKWQKPVPNATPGTGRKWLES